VQLQQVFMNLILNSIEAMKEANGARELNGQVRAGREQSLAHLGH